MALFHMNFKIVKRSEGKSSVAKVAYNNRARIEDTRTGQTYDYRHKKDLALHTILSPASAPAEIVKNSAILWNTLEHTEKRKDAQICRSFEISLHNELTEQENIDLFLAFAKKSFTSKGMIADLAFHRGTNGDNFHVHGALSLREVSANGFGKKVREWNEHTLIEEWRKDWADMSNRALKAAGHKVRIDNRSLKAQQAEAIEKAQATTDSKKKAIYTAKAIKLDREPMRRLSAKSWHTERTQQIRQHEQEIRDQKVKEARSFIRTIKSMEKPDPAPAVASAPVVKRSKTKRTKTPKNDFWKKIWKTVKTLKKSLSQQKEPEDEYNDDMEVLAQMLDNNPRLREKEHSERYSEDLDVSDDNRHTPDHDHSYNLKNEESYKPRRFKP